MRKRVAMAASLIHHPELFLMDEPFEGVDAVGARLMKDILLDQVQRGATIFLTSHVLEVVERLCDRVAIINEGRIVTSAALSDLRAGGESLEDAFVRLVGAEHADRQAGLAMIAAILRAQLLSMRKGGRGRGVVRHHRPVLVRALGGGGLRGISRRSGGFRREVAITVAAGGAGGVPVLAGDADSFGQHGLVARYAEADGLSRAARANCSRWRCCCA